MRRRSAMTMVEVLMAMFIMAIGMMALLTLFPLGAISMAQALKDDRCASAASMGENVAIAQNVRAMAIGSTTLMYVDPIGTTNGFNSPLGGVIPRVAPGFITSAAVPKYAADRWFSLPDDITFLENGTPDTVSTGGSIDRGRRYSYAYLLRPLSSSLVQLYVVVYSGRPVPPLTPETTLAVTSVLGINGLQLGPPTPPAAMTIKRGGWILDPNNGNFYRVTNLADAGGGNTTVEVQPNLIGTPTQVAIMDDVAEVFDKGTGWLP